MQTQVTGDCISRRNSKNAGEHWHWPLLQLWKYLLGDFFQLIVLLVFFIFNVPSHQVWPEKTWPGCGSNCKFCTWTLDQKPSSGAHHVSCHRWVQLCHGTWHINFHTPSETAPFFFFLRGKKRVLEHLSPLKNTELAHRWCLIKNTQAEMFLVLVCAVWNLFLLFPHSVAEGVSPGRWQPILSFPFSSLGSSLGELTHKQIHSSWTQSELGSSWATGTPGCSAKAFPCCTSGVLSQSQKCGIYYFQN